MFALLILFSGFSFLGMNLLVLFSMRLFSFYLMYHLVTMGLIEISLDILNFSS
jgi:hypothetical protein